MRSDHLAVLSTNHFANIRKYFVQRHQHLRTALVQTHPPVVGPGLKFHSPGQEQAELELVRHLYIVDQHGVKLDGAF